jgi:hypothetical protein
VVGAVGDQVIANIPAWQATETVLQIREGKRQMEIPVQVEYAYRDAVHPAHIWANWVRRTHRSYEGATTPMQMLDYDQVENGVRRWFVREPD